MKVKGTRTFLELRVGRRQSVEVILQLRRSDLDWFNNNNSDTNGMANLLALLQTSILPRIFEQEIESNFYRFACAACADKQGSNTIPQPPPEHIGPGGIPLDAVGGGTKPAAAAATATGRGKRHRANNKTTAKAAAKKQREEQKRNIENGLLKKERDVHYALSDTMQIVYRLEPVIGSYSSATLLFGEEQNDSQKLVALHKLSQRIVLWCYPRHSGENNNPDDDDDCIPTEEGFWRPELIPLSSLFAAAPASEPP